MAPPRPAASIEDAGARHDLDRAVHIFSAPQASDAALHVRRVAALNTLGRTPGFAVPDLPRVGQVLDRTLDLILNTQYAALFTEPTCGLIRAIGQPYRKHSATDELRLLPALAGVLRALARVFDQAVPWQLQACSAEVVADLASVWGNRPAEPVGRRVIPDLQSVQRTYQAHQRSLGASGIVPCVCAALQAAVASATGGDGGRCASSTTSGSSGTQLPQSSGQLVPALVGALLECSTSQELCEQQLHAGVLPVLSELLLAEAAAGLQGGLGSRIMELLWNVFELAGDGAIDQVPGTTAGIGEGRRQQEVQQLGATASQAPHQQQCQQPGCSVPEQVVAALDATLRQQHRPDSSVQVRQQRNDTLTVLYHLSRQRSFVPAVASSASLLQLLLEAAVGGGCVDAAAYSSAPGLTKAAGSLSSSEGSVEADHNMQLLAWNILGMTAAASPACLQAVLDAGLLRLLLSVAGSSSGGGAAGGLVDSRPAEVTAWWARLSPEQLMASQDLAWSLLQQLAPACTPCFIASGGMGLLVSTWQAFATHGGSTDALSSSAWLSTAQAAPAPVVSPKRRALGTGVLVSSTAGATRAAAGGCRSACVASALRLLQRLVQGPSDAAAAAATAALAQGAVPVLLQLLQSPAAAAATPVRQGVLLALSGLCSSAGGHGCVAAVRQADGVVLLLRECQSVLEGDPHVASLAVLDGVWRCCLPSARSRAQLLAADGMDTLLSLLHRGSPGLQPVLLSLLGDLLGDPRAHRFFWEWHAPVADGGSGWGGSSNSSFSVPCMRPASGGSEAAGAAAAVAGADGTLQSSLAPGSSTISSILSGSQPGAPWILACCSAGDGAAAPPMSSSSITGAQLLVGIWRRQDQALGLSGPDGILSNPDRPLAGCQACARPQLPGAAAGPPLEAAAAGAAAAGAGAVLLGKVFACFVALGVAGTRDASLVSAEGLRVLQRLPAEDAAVLAAVQHYAAFRQGEVWQDIRAQLEAAGLQPTQEDSARLESGIQHAQTLAAQVQATQAALLDSANAAKLAAERLLYGNMAAQLAADAKARVYEKDTSRLTMRERLAAKAKKEEMLQRLKPMGAAAAQQSVLI